MSVRAAKQRLTNLVDLGTSNEIIRALEPLLGLFIIYFAT
jgi:hypothetical protein